MFNWDMFNRYPYINLTDRNLDMLTRAIREMQNEVKNFVSINAVKYANPIQWNINRQYEKNTITIDPLTGTAFISVQPVPNGVALTRTEYWTPVFDLSQFVTKAASNFANSYERDITTTATMPTGAGDWVVWDSTLYVALNAIHAGDAYVVGGNIKRMTIEDFYDLLMQAIHSLDEELDTEIRNRTNSVSTLQGNIDAEARARGEADTTLQSNIDAEARARGEADTTLQSNIDAEARARGEADATLQGNIDAEARALADRINTEILDRISGDNALSGRIDSVASSSRMVTPEQFGAVGDGETDDTLAVQSAINSGMENGKIVMLTNKYLVNTLLVNDSVEICGGGTLYTPPFRYDVTTSVLNDNNRYFTTSHPEYYHPNTFITVGNWQALVVTSVNGNEIHVAPTYVENDDDVVDSKAAGSKVSIHKMAIWIGKTNTYTTAVLDNISNIDIHDITIIGNQSDYSLANETVMDYRQNGHISAYSCENLRIHNCIFETAQCNVVGVYGKQYYAKIYNNHISHCHVANVNTALDYKETAGGICFHYDSKFIVATNAAYYCEVTGNTITDCFEGIFMSAASYTNICNNKISNCDYRGIMIYHGDYSFNCRNNVCAGNILNGCNTINDGVSGAISLSGAAQSVINNNVILLGVCGLHCANSEDIIISNCEFMAQSGSGIYLYSGSDYKIHGCMFNMSGQQHVLLYDHGNDGIAAQISNNTHKGSPASKYYYFYKCERTIVENCNVERSTLSRFASVNTSNITSGQVIIIGCYVSQGIVETSAELNLLKYLNCVTNAYLVLSNMTP